MGVTQWFLFVFVLDFEFISLWFSETPHAIVKSITFLHVNAVSSIWTARSFSLFAWSLIFALNANQSRLIIVGLLLNFAEISFFRRIELGRCRIRAIKIVLNFGFALGKKDAATGFEGKRPVLLEVFPANNGRVFVDNAELVFEMSQFSRYRIKITVEWWVFYWTKWDTNEGWFGVWVPFCDPKGPTLSSCRLCRSVSHNWWDNRQKNESLWCSCGKSLISSN